MQNRDIGKDHAGGSAPVIGADGAALPAAVV
jgi:hypothetical protein